MAGDDLVYTVRFVARVEQGKATWSPSRAIALPLMSWLAGPLMTVQPWSVLSSTVISLVTFGSSAFDAVTKLFPQG
jgi:hypothetical protein